MGITDLSPELIESILLHCDPVDVAALSQCSRAFSSLIYNTDSYLWRTLYLLQPLDDPRTCVSPSGMLRDIDIPWQQELQHIIRARNVARNVSLCRPSETKEILRTLVNVASYTPPLSSPDSLPSRNLIWLGALMKNNSAILDDSLPSSTTGEEAQLRSQLHTLYGLIPSDLTKTARLDARAFVYDFRNYRPENCFGPAQEDGSVDWVHVLAVFKIMTLYLKDLYEELESFNVPVFTVDFNAMQPRIPADLNLDKELDWAGVSGKWKVCFCFCDHTQLIAYNSSAATRHDPLDKTLFGTPSFHEIFRAMELHLNVIKAIPDPDHPTRPKLFFAGQNGLHSTITGWVKMTPDSHVRWHFISGDNGNAVWSSEGIQLGGLRAQCGVFGTWTTIFHDPEDPVGPFCMKKANFSEGEEED